MRIAFIAHLSEISGAGVALLDTASAFLAAGHSVWLVLPDQGELAARATGRGVDVIVISNPEIAIADADARTKVSVAMNRARYIGRLRDFLRQNQVQVAYVNSSASIFAGLAARLAAVPIVWHIHETLDSTDRRTELKKRIIRHLAARLVYASKSAVEYFPPGRLPAVIARNAIDMDKLRRVRADRQARRGIEPHGTEIQSAQSPTLLLNGTIRRKGADVLLEAVKLLRQRNRGFHPQVVITGASSTDPAFFTELQNQLNYDLSGIVTFPGVQPSLAPWFEKASLYISASRNEAMPIAIVEAMASGVPVIATAVGDCADLLDNGKCGLVIPPENAPALADAIEEALQNQTETVARTNAAIEKSELLYGTDDFWDLLIRFVEAVPRET